MKAHAGALGDLALQWFEVMRKCGDEVRELVHDGCPVACLGDVPFGYVNAHLARQRGVLSGRISGGPDPLVARHRQVYASCEVESGSDRERRSAQQAHRSGVRGYQGARRKRLEQFHNSCALFSSVKGGIFSRKMPLCSGGFGIQQL